MRDKNKQKVLKREQRHNRVRGKVGGTKSRPRFSVFRSLKGMYGQIIDDQKGHTLVSADWREIKIKEPKLTKTQIALELGKLIAQKAKEAGISQVVFDRGGYQYHGRVKAVAEGARGEGLIF